MQRVSRPKQCYLPIPGLWYTLAILLSLYGIHSEMSTGIKSGTRPAGFLECHLAGEVGRKMTKSPQIEKL